VQAPRAGERRLVLGQQRGRAGQQLAGDVHVGGQRPKARQQIVDAVAAADPAGAGGEAEAPPALEARVVDVRAGRGRHLDGVAVARVIGAPAVGHRAHVGQARDDALTEQIAHRQETIFARRAHRGGEGITAEADLQRLLHHHVVDPALPATCALVLLHHQRAHAADAAAHRTTSTFTTAL
jgi:hypothetical protein